MGRLRSHYGVSQDQPRPAAKVLAKRLRLLLSAHTGVTQFDIWYAKIRHGQTTLTIRVPKSLRKLRLGQVQRDIGWPRDRWDEAFPAQSVFRTLPDRLSRERVRRTCAESEASEEAATEAFLAAMAWGHGKVGYGPWRVAQALTDRDAGRKLLDVATVLNSDGPQAAYRLMAGASRLHLIGPAFGTKFLYFADAGRHDRRALILDKLIAEWLRVNTPTSE